MANTAAATLTVLKGVIGCTGMRDPFTLLLAVVHDPGRQTRSVLDQFLVGLASDTQHGAGDYCSEMGDDLIDQQPTGFSGHDIPFF
jgi:hypothetical protein